METKDTTARYGELMGSYADRKAEAKSDGSQWGMVETQDWYDGLSELDKLIWDAQGKTFVADLHLEDGETVEALARQWAAWHDLGVVELPCEAGHYSVLLAGPELFKVWLDQHGRVPIPLPDELTVYTLLRLLAKKAPYAAIYGSLEHPEKNGWLYNAINQISTDQGQTLWHVLCDELAARERGDAREA